MDSDPSSVSSFVSVESHSRPSSTTTPYTCSSIFSQSSSFHLFEESFLLQQSPYLCVSPGEVVGDGPVTDTTTTSTTTTIRVTTWIPPTPPPPLPPGTTIEGFSPHIEDHGVCPRMASMPAFSRPPPPPLPIDLSISSVSPRSGKASNRSSRTSIKPKPLPKLPTAQSEPGIDNDLRVKRKEMIRSSTEPIDPDDSPLKTDRVNQKKLDHRRYFSNTDYSQGPPPPTPLFPPRPKTSSPLSPPKKKYVKLDLPPVVLDNEKKFAHEPAVDELYEPKLIEIRDIYEEDFYSNVHWNFIGIHNIKKEDLVLSVLKPKTPNEPYRCLKTLKKGTEEFSIDQQTLEEFSKNKTKKTSHKLESYLNKEGLGSTTNFTFYYTDNATFSGELREIEKNHPQKVGSIKIAFLYSRGGEQTLLDLFAHTEKTVDLESCMCFLDLLGEKINLKGWKKYLGDITGVETNQYSYYTEWKGIEIMFHIGIWMNAEQHRRLLGNDIVFVIFHDNPHNPFVPLPLDSLGTVPQIFAVVQKWPTDKYRLHLFSRPNIKPYYPYCPNNYLFEGSELKEFLLTKVYNGYCQALQCPPMNRLFEVPRAASITELTTKYPKESHAAKQRREKGAKIKRRIQQENIKDPLFLMVNVICALPGSEITNPVVSVIVLDQEQKTKTIKGKILHPKWGDPLVFNVLGVDPAIHFVKVELRGGKIQQQQVGQIEISFRDICSDLDKEKWLEMIGGDSTARTKTSSGVICLKFSLKGPSAVLCTMCELFLGSLPIVVCNNVKYHARCIRCSVCSKSVDNGIYEHDNEFYCRKDYRKKFPTESNTTTTATSTTTSTATTITSSTTTINTTTSTITTATNNTTSTTVTITTPTTITSNIIISSETSEDSLLISFSTPTVVESPHIWQETHFKTLIEWCGACRGTIPLGTVACSCSECQYICHKECKELIQQNCPHYLLSKTQEIPGAKVVAIEGGDEKTLSSLSKSGKRGTRPLSSYVFDSKLSRSKDQPLSDYEEEYSANPLVDASSTSNDSRFSHSDRDSDLVLHPITLSPTTTPTTNEISNRLSNVSTFADGGGGVSIHRKNKMIRNKSVQLRMSITHALKPKPLKRSTSNPDISSSDTDREIL